MIRYVYKNVTIQYLIFNSFILYKSISIPINVYTFSLT